MYKARIHYEAYEDDYEEGQSFDLVSNWGEQIQEETLGELYSRVLEATYSKAGDLDDDQMNEYEDYTEYHTSYLSNGNNEGEATPSEVEAWKQGRLKLYAINCHILVSEVTEKKARLYG